MHILEALEFARRHSEVVRERQHLLYTFGATRLPYVCVTDGENGTLLHEGEVTADRPNIIFPGRDAAFSGFADDDGEIPVFLARAIRLPAGSYANHATPSRPVPGTVDEAVERELARLDAGHDIRTGVIRSPETVWRLAVLLYVGAQVVRSAGANISEQVERLRLRGS